MRPPAVALLVLAICGCDSRPLEHVAGHAMGTSYEVVVTRPPRDLRRDDLQREVDAVLEEVDRHLSTWNPQSEVSQFNAGQGREWVPVSAILHESLSRARAVSRMTGGGFDITVAPLVRAWGIGAGAVEPVAEPTDAELRRLMQSVGHAKLEMRADPPALRKAVPALQVDLDGIAPGLAVDRIAARLEARGARDYLVELGGEVRARGRSPAGRHWRIAVEAPLPGERRPYALVEIDGLGISTSGDYRDVREVAGRRRSHIIDPRTGVPVDHGLASVTVIRSSAAEADAWATALMVLGPEWGLALAEQRNVAALFIRRDGNGAMHESATSAFAAFRRPLHRAL